MGTAVSLLMVAASAIMVWAVSTTASSFSIHSVGTIVDGGRWRGTRALDHLLVAPGRYNRRARRDSKTTIVER